MEKIPLGNSGILRQFHDVKEFYILYTFLVSERWSLGDTQK